MTATLKPKQLRDFAEALHTAHPDDEFQQPIPVNNSTSALMRVVTEQDADTVKSWFELAGYQTKEIQRSTYGGWIVEFWQAAKVKTVKRNGGGVKPQRIDHEFTSREGKLERKR